MHPDIRIETHRRATLPLADAKFRAQFRNVPCGPPLGLIVTWCLFGAPLCVDGPEGNTAGVQTEPEGTLPVTAKRHTGQQAGELA